MIKSEHAAPDLVTQLASLQMAERFMAAESAAKANKPMPFNRRDYYKISLSLGTSRLYYANRGIIINKPALIFSNPMIPYAWEPISEKQEGYFCLFMEGFLTVNDQHITLQESPLFKIGADPVFFIDDEQVEYVSGVFQRMIKEFNSTYAYKFDILRNLANLLMHEAMKMQPSANYFKHQNAAERITSLFLKLLDQQFPIDSPQQALKLRAANHYAEQMSVHVNHLNRAVKEATGKTTTEHLNDRIISEAKTLLQNTTWGISEIAYSLGYQYTTYFNNFFKKQTGANPGFFR